MTKVVRSVYITKETEERIRKMSEVKGISFNKMAEKLLEEGIANVEM